MKMERGFRGKLEDYLDISQPFQVRVRTIGPAVYDSCCFGLDTANKLSDDRYMVFYNQTSSPGQEITYSAQVNDARYQIRLNDLPAGVAKLAFTISIDGNGTMGTINSNIIDVVQNGNTVLQLSLNGTDFLSEMSVVCIEIYLKSVWRIAAVARGFNFGLGELVKSFGGEIAVEASKKSTPLPETPAPEEAQPDAPVQEEAQPDAPPVIEVTSLTEILMSKIKLSKDKANLEKHVVNLSESIIDLSKKSQAALWNTQCKVVVALDYSKSMGTLYRNGTVQQTINKLVPLGLAFDGDGSVGMFLFQNDFRKIPDLNLSNYACYVQQIISDSNYPMGGTYYSPVLKAIIEGSSASIGGGFFNAPRITPIRSLADGGDPTLILFITDGDNFDRNATDAVIRRSSEKNVFIQFIGIGNEAFSYLKQLKDMPDENKNHTSFSQIQDLASADDKALYTNLLSQFANWLKELQ